VGTTTTLSSTFVRDSVVEFVEDMTMDSLRAAVLAVRFLAQQPAIV
jgi:hypothetical protein